MENHSILDRLLARLGLARAHARPPLTGAPWELPPSAPARREAARWAYRTILLREPESLEPLDHLARNSASARAMRDMLLQSAEARAQPAFPITPSMSGNEPPQAVQAEVPDVERNALFRRVQGVWHSLGEQRPHWSVVTADEFLPENIDASLDRFYATGEGNVDTLLRTLARNGVDAGRIAHCLDFGCGVGRLSAALARRFPRVTAVDVSASHLALAREALGKRGVTNVAFELLETIDGVQRLPHADLVYSLIVLQHNPPPVMRALLAGLLGRLNPGGVAVIQLPTYLPAGYRFDVDEYRKREDRDMEMHALPQREVFAVAREAEVEVREVLEDTWTGYGAGSRSNTFVMQRPAARP
jgi:SAM-dependent methyltransferase